MPATKQFIFNADDFGQSAGVNRGILQAHANGVVTSTSVLVRWPAASELPAAAKAHPKLAFGLHLDLGEWVCTDGDWRPLYRVLSEADESSVDAVTAEVERQLQAFRQLAGRDPTHIDSHQHVHRQDPLRSILSRVASNLGVPLRHFDARVRYVGDFYGQLHTGEPFPDGVSVENLIRLIDAAAEGVTEFGCHPGIGVDHASPYATEREYEVQSLCDRRVITALARAGARLASFGDYANDL